MLAAISEYVRGVALCVIIMSLAQIIVPNGKFKQYVSLCAGIILVLALIRPLGNIFASIKKENFSASFSALPIPTSLPSDASANALIIAEYEKNLSASIKDFVDAQAGNTGFYFENADFDIESSEQDFGRINSVAVFVTKNPPKQGFIRIEKIEVPPLPFSEVFAPASPTESPEIISLKSSISRFYNLSEHNIYIEVQDNGGDE